ncbi:MAG: PQQ-binding-like beta-propeller repeat protein [Planctomycetota bacterium]
MAALALVAALRLLPRSQAVDLGWPGIFGPDNNSITAESFDVSLLTPSGPPEKYRVEIGTGYSSPVAVDGRAVVLHRVDDEERLTCLDIETGDPLWEHRYPTTYQCRYEYTDGPYGTPLIHGGRVFALGAQWQAHCVDLATGAVVWRRDLSEDFDVEEGLFGFGPGMVVDAGRLIFNLGAEGAGVVALDAATGETVWVSGRDRSSFTTPRLATIHGRRYAFVLTFEGLQALDPVTGEPYWFVPFSSRAPDSVTATSPVVAGDLVLLVTGPGPGAKCLRIMPGGGWEEVWNDRRRLDSQWNTLVERGGVVYGYTSKRVTTSFRCLELATGKLRWSWTSDLDRGSSILSGDTFILWGEHGDLAFVAADPRRHRLHWMSGAALLASPTYASPALHRGLLLMRDESELLCLSLREADLRAAAAGRR